MTIREINKTDLQGLLRLYTQLHNNPMPPATAELDTLWQQILQDKNHHIILAIEAGQIVSACVLVIVPNLTHGQRPYALIENVITDAAHRRRGLASACLQRARQIAAENDCYKIMLLTGAKDAGTLQFYRSCGFNSADKTAFIQWLPAAPPQKQEE